MIKTFLLKLRKLFKFSFWKKEAEQVAGPKIEHSPFFTMSPVGDASLIGKNPTTPIPAKYTTGGEARGIEDAFKAINDIQYKMREIQENSIRTEERAERTEKETKRVENIVFLGFLGLLFVVAGLVFSFCYFVYENTVNQQYLNSGILNKEVLEQTVNMNYREFNGYKTLSQKNDVILTCIKNRGYFSISCFDN